MANLVKQLVDAARRFTAWDFAVFKLTLLSIGILLGAYFARFFFDWIVVVWVVAVVCWLLMIVQVVRYLRR